MTKTELKCFVLKEFYARKFTRCKCKIRLGGKGVISNVILYFSYLNSTATDKEYTTCTQTLAAQHRSFSHKIFIYKIVPQFFGVLPNMVLSLLSYKAVVIFSHVVLSDGFSNVKGCTPFSFPFVTAMAFHRTRSPY